MWLLIEVNMVLNPKGSLITNLAVFDTKGFDKLPLAHIKYEHWYKAYEDIPHIVKPVLDKMFSIMPDNDKHWLVDYKVRDLKKGDSGVDVAGWHLDCITNPRHNSKPETHLLFSTHFGTEYILDELEVLPEETHFKQVLKRYSDDFWFAQVKPNTITQYGRFNLHRAPIAKYDCRRMTLRLTQTEVI